MSCNWVLNQMCGPLSEERMSAIPRPRMEMASHVTVKTTVTGGLLGTLVVGPTVALVKGDRTTEGLKTWADTCGTYGALMGFLAGPLLCQVVLRSLEANDDSIWDRCYRIRYNRKQLRVDRFAMVGALAGYGAAVYLGEKATLGALLGMSGGALFAGFVLNSFLPR